jgi:hypothetical protein
MTEFLTRSVRVYFQQLTVGCGQAHCDNPGCASCPDFVPIDPNEAASRSIKAAAGIEKISRCWPLVPAAERVAYVPDLIMEIASHLGPADWSRFRAISSRFRDASCDLRVLVRVAKNCKGGAREGYGLSPKEWASAETAHRMLKYVLKGPGNVSANVFQTLAPYACKLPGQGRAIFDAVPIPRKLWMVKQGLFLPEQFDYYRGTPEGDELTDLLLSKGRRPGPHHLLYAIRHDDEAQERYYIEKCGLCVHDAALRFLDGTVPLGGPRPDHIPNSSISDSILSTRRIELFQKLLLRGANLFIERSPERNGDNRLNPIVAIFGDSTSGESTWRMEADIYIRAVPPELKHSVLAESLLECIWVCHLEQTTWVLQQGVDVNYEFGICCVEDPLRKFTALCLVLDELSRWHDECFDYMGEPYLQHGSVESQYLGGMFKLLLENGADPHVVVEYSNDYDNPNWIPSSLLRYHLHRSIPTKYGRPLLPWLWACGVQPLNADEEAELRRGTPERQVEPVWPPPADFVPPIGFPMHLRKKLVSAGLQRKLEREKTENENQDTKHRRLE